MSAPYAELTIPIYLKATNGPRYRTLSCVECGQSFLERQDNDFYRLNTTDLPESARLNDAGAVETLCGNCHQKYLVYFSPIQPDYRGDMLAYQKPLTLFIVNAESKSPRNTYCMECHHAYLSISDRVNMIADEAVPLDGQKTGPVEVRCKSQRCKQRWQVVL